PATTTLYTLSLHDALPILPLGEHILILTKSGYITAKYPITVDEFQTVNITDMILEIDNLTQDLFTITLTEDELDNDESGFGNVSDRKSTRLNSSHVKISYA